MPTATSSSTSSRPTVYRAAHVLRRDRLVQRVPRDRLRHLHARRQPLCVGRNVQLHPTRPRPKPDAQPVVTATTGLGRVRPSQATWLSVRSMSAAVSGTTRAGK